MKILAVETSAAPASAALFEDDCMIGESYARIRSVHSRTLMPAVQALLATCGTDISEIGLFAVSAGPGSFTGVRIGVAAVKGMAMMKDTPCAAVSTLEAIAYGAGLFPGIICAVMDARCGQVYNAMFEQGPEGLVRLTEDRAITVADLEKELEKYKKSSILVGDGAKICYNQLSDTLGTGIAPEVFRYQRASCVAALAFGLYGRGQVLSAAQLMPVYLRRPQAERERLAKSKKAPSSL
ncbi:MAG: tRNA (adenosine(37)-N6)-threonylcarbamoyltransferase complex dimerization subunit type 1 TsaB [Clostridia bacterium]|nr:tRNA (adenosine(37)-N6)-threonylcarbamoyltransferase complex dimerization subunit type 1 TsaB [Clostridia bacterium]